MWTVTTQTKWVLSLFHPLFVPSLGSSKSLLGYLFAAVNILVLVPLRAGLELALFISHPTCQGQALGVSVISLQN